MVDLKTLTQQLDEATTYIEIFGDPDTIKDDYRRFARLLHPDRAAGSSKAFHRLSVFKAEALQMLAEGRWGERTTLATIRTKRATHQITRKMGEDTMAVYYRAATTTGEGTISTMVKVAKSAKDNDLMAQEARALKKLAEPDDNLTRHFPVLHDTFMHSEGRRRANVTPLYDGFHSLASVRQAFPKGLDPVHGVWIFRRLLMGLGFAHEQGLVHGAVTPDNILIGPEDHAVVLIDWCYSQVIDAESKTNFIKAVVPMYKALYAPEVFEKKSPNQATDLYMAATLMSYLMPVAPKPFRAFFKGTALASQNARPQNAWGLLKEFDELLEGIGQPFHPRRFVEFVMPVGATS